MTIIENNYKIGQEVWFEGYKSRPTNGFIESIGRVGMILVYRIEKIHLAFREDQLFLTKEEAEHANTA